MRWHRLGHAEKTCSYCIENEPGSHKGCYGTSSRTTRSPTQSYFWDCMRVGLMISVESIKFNFALHLCQSSQSVRTQSQTRAVPFAYLLRYEYIGNKCILLIYYQIMVPEACTFADQPVLEVNDMQEWQNESHKYFDWDGLFSCPTGTRLRTVKSLYYVRSHYIDQLYYKENCM